MEKIADSPTEEKPTERDFIAIPKNSLEELRLSIREYGGHTFADLRTYYRDDDSGEMCPSRKGVTVSPDTWPLFRCALDQLDEQLQRSGLLEEEEGV